MAAGCADARPRFRVHRTPGGAKNSVAPQGGTGSHLGVLHALEQNQIPIDFIAGTSAGALAGIAYASGLPYDEVVRRAGALRFGVFGQWKFSWLGLASNQRLEFYPKRFLNITTFEELRIPVAIAATDLLTGEPVYFERGPLGPALRASCAYPGLFQPVKYEGRTLVDGFVGATVPVEAAFKMGADVVAAVFLDSETAVEPTNFTDVIGRSFTIIQRHADLAWRSRADVVIEPLVREFAWDDFSKTPQLVAAGEEAALMALPRIRSALEAATERLGAEESGIVTTGTSWGQR
jgi:NTE family protein